MRFRLGRRGLLLTAAAVGLLTFGVGTAVAVFPDTDVKTYTGCLTSGGTVVYVKEGNLPTQTCTSPKQLVKLGGGDITKVSVTGALTGGGDNGAVTIGLDSKATAPTSCGDGQLMRWNATDQGWVCRDKYAAGTGLGLASDKSFSVSDSYRLPQSCGAGTVAKSNGAGGWTCGTDDVGTAPPVYFVSHQHVVESFSDWQEIGGLSDLPAGSYMFTTTIHNFAYVTENSVTSAHLLCSPYVNGQPTGSLAIPPNEDAADTYAVTVPEGSTFIVSCVLIHHDFDGEDDATEPTVHITALKVGAVNP